MPGVDVEDLTGTMIGGCRLLRRLGHGGIGAVYEGQRSDGGTVAVKVLFPTAAVREGLIERFQREARLAFQIDHPAIVRVRHWGEEGHRYFLVMDLISGATLERLVRHHGALTWSVATAVAADVADGLAHLHAFGILHRDLKPANILVTREGRGLLADLGLARQSVESPDEPGGRRLTAPGSVIGSPAFMAPEQIIDTAAVGPEADVYALAASLYFALSGRPPLLEESTTSTLRAVLSECPPSIGALAGGLPEALGLLVDACLAKKPEDRPVDAAAFRDALREGLADAGY